MATSSSADWPFATVDKTDATSWQLECCWCHLTWSYTHEPREFALAAIACPLCGAWQAIAGGISIPGPVNDDYSEEA